MSELQTRIQQAYAQSNARQHAEGLRWYSDAHTFAESLANASGGRITTEQVAGVIAVTSPVQPWTAQQVFVPILIKQYLEGQAPEKSFGFVRNTLKAWSVLSGDLSVITGPKVTRFFLAIMGDTNAITVDRWIARVAYGHEVDGVSNKQYVEVAEAIRAASEQIGVPPRELQAILWVWARGTMKSWRPERIMRSGYSGSQQATAKKRTI